MFSQMAFLILIVQNSLIYSRTLFYIYRINFDRIIIYNKMSTFYLAATTKFTAINYSAIIKCIGNECVGGGEEDKTEVRYRILVSGFHLITKRLFNSMRLQTDK